MRERERGREAALEGRISIYAHSLACSICQLHADVTPPRAAHLPATTCPPPLSLHPPLPWQHKSQSILHNAMRAWLNGGVAPAPLPSALCIPHTKHAATFLASSRCVCICPTVRHNGDKGGTQNFLCCIYPVAAQQEEGGRGEVLPQTV